ncbi:MAG: bifunctional sulfate adenylyltransferase/adenylylsulfate kinase [Rhodothermaceae bacterium]|nr:bifunctional sulfate adenylyltransferase/adenylylsulfate kinase [Rhodothermaceae bacterium]
MTETTLIAPHGGELCDLVRTGAAADALREEAQDLTSLTLSDRQICDIELILNGGFSPLTGFLTQEDYDSVVADMRLADGTLWPMPITFDTDEETAAGLSLGDRVALRDKTGLLIAVMTIESKWTPSKEHEAKEVFGTTDTKHPAVNYLFNAAGDVYLGGALEGVQLPIHYDYTELRHTPAELRAKFEAMGRDHIVAFQTRNPMHRAHYELTHRAAEEIGGMLLIHPVVGMTKPGDVDHYTRVRCYQAILKQYPEGEAMLSLLPLAMRMGGPREAIWHALIRKNHGCTHLVVGRDHAGPGNDANGEPFYGPYDAQELFQQHEEEMGVKMVPFQLMVYVPEDDAYMPIDEANAQGKKFENISGTQQREMLANGEEIPSWFTYPDVVKELKTSHPPKSQQGFTVFFTGLSGSGKSTIANALIDRLMESGRNVTLLDGDVVRTHLSKGLGFSREDRSTNVQRIGYVASEITKHGGIAVCAPIAPYEADRKANRAAIEAGGGYIEAFVNTPLEVCEARDVKGLYAMARAGKIKEFTGISDPYEEPTDAEILLPSQDLSVAESVDKVMDYLQQEGYLPAEG